jgi:hypothetical protein
MDEAPMRLTIVSITAKSEGRTDRHITHISIKISMTDSTETDLGYLVRGLLATVILGFGGLAIAGFALLRWSSDSAEFIDSSCCMFAVGFGLIFASMVISNAGIKNAQVSNLDSTLEGRERVIHSAIGSYGDDHTVVFKHIIAATESRVFIRRNGVLSDTVSIPYGKINSLRHGQKMTGYEIEIHMSGKSHRMIGLTEVVEPKKLADFIQGKIDQTVSSDSSENISLSNKESNADILRELKKLFEDGIISEEEYENKRKEIIDRI